MFPIRAAERLSTTLALSALSILCLTPVNLSAGVLYSNISSAFPGKSVNTQFSIDNAFAGTPFTTIGSGSLASIVIALSQTTGSPAVTAGLYTDVYSNPGALLESWTIPVIPTCCGNVPASVPPLTTLTSVLHPQLYSGTRYWFVMNVGAKNSVYWWYNDLGVNGGLWSHTTLNPLYQGNSTAAMPGIQLNSVQPQSPARTGVLSHVAAGGGWSTVITLVNTSSAAVPLTLAFHGDDGSALTLPVTTQQGGSQTATTAPVNATLNPNTTLIISVGDQIASTVTGWADVQSIGSVGGYAIFRWTPQTGSPQEGTVPLQSQFPATITLPYDNTAGFTTGVALANLSASSAGVIATVWDDSGNLLGTKNIEIVGNGHTSFNLPTELPQTATQLGIVSFESTASGGIAGLGLRFSPFGTFTSVPTILPQ
jgi:hypothetical protein